MHKIFGQTRAMLEGHADRGQIAMLDRAEKSAGFRTGMRGVEGGLVMISIRFYPKKIFYIQDVLSFTPEHVYGPHRVLTQEEWEKTRDWL